jgi:hypothetical protein
MTKERIVARRVPFSRDRALVKDTVVVGAVTGVAFSDDPFLAVALSYLSSGAKPRGLLQGEYRFQGIGRL